MKKHHKVLLDVSLAAGKANSGMAQDLRLIFKNLRIHQDKIDLSCLLYPIPWKNSKVMSSNTDISAIVTDIGPKDIAELSKKKLIPKYIKLIIDYSFLLKHLFQTNFPLNELKPISIYEKFIWRNFFANTLDAKKDKKYVRNVPFILSSFSLNKLFFQFSNFFMRPKVIINTSDYDFLILQDVRKITPSKNTIKIVRYHDIIPVKSVDLVAHKYSIQHYNSLKFCANEDSTVFVCNSLPVKEDLIRLFPQLKDRTHVIPCMLPVQYKKVNDAERLLDILKTNYALSTFEKSEKSSRQKIFNNLQNLKNFKYILHVATIDPKKNLISLIKAWRKMNLKNKSDIKLIVCGSLGWDYELIVKTMRPYILDGSLIHVEKISEADLPYLYSHAEAFVFPSYEEGFGLPPLEAMQCGCPTIVSDIAAHRWVMGDASLYCDPYDIDDISEKIESLVLKSGKASTKKALIKKGHERVKLYNQKRVGDMWIELLDNLKEKH